MGAHGNLFWLFLSCERHLMPTIKNTNVRGIPLLFTRQFVFFEIRARAFFQRCLEVIPIWLSRDGFKRNNFIVAANGFGYPFNLFLGIVIDIIP